MATLREGEVREVEIPLRDKAYLAVLVSSLFTQQCEQRADLTQQPMALALLLRLLALSGWVLASHREVLPTATPPSHRQGQNLWSIPTLTHSSASPSSMTSSHSPSVMVSSSSCPAWAPQGRIQDMAVSHSLFSEVLNPMPT